MIFVMITFSTGKLRKNVENKIGAKNGENMW